jgi:hypothetical protein
MYTLTSDSHSIIEHQDKRSDETVAMSDNGNQDLDARGHARGRGSHLDPRRSHRYQHPSHQQGYGQQQRQGGEHFQARQGQQGHHHGRQQHLSAPPPPPAAYGGFQRQQSSGIPQEPVRPQTKTATSDTLLFEDYLLDQCELGTKCHQDHPPALDTTKKEIDFKFDTSVGGACERCTKLLLPVCNPIRHDDNY